VARVHLGLSKQPVELTHLATPIELELSTARSDYSGDRWRVSSSKTQVTRPDRIINGLKGFSELTLRRNSSTFTISSNDLSALCRSLLFVELCSSPIFAHRCRSLPLHRQSLLVVCNVASSSSPPSPSSLKFDLSIPSHSISLLFCRNIDRSSLSLIHLHC